MSNIRKKLALSLMIGVLGLTAIGGSASATGTDLIVHPNSSCKWHSDWYRDFQSPQVPPAEYSTNGWAHFDDSGPHEVVCGIDRFNLTNTNGLRDLDIRLNNQSGETVSLACTAYSARPDGSAIKIVNQPATFIGPHRVDFGDSLDLSVAYGAYSVACSLPRSVVLNNILQREY